MNESFMLGQIQKEDMLLGLMAILLILSVISLRRISVTKRTLGYVVKIVQEYLEAVCEEEAAGSGADLQEKALQPDSGGAERIHKVSKEEEQNRIISTVLQEIFP